MKYKNEVIRRKVVSAIKIKFCTVQKNNNTQPTIISLLII